MNFHLLFAATTIAVSLSVVGCQPSASTTRENSTSNSQSEQTRPRIDAKSRLREVFQRYQVCSYYEDDGEVVIRASGSRSFAAGRNATSRETQSAPLRVHLDQRELNVDAYMARIRVNVVSNASSGASERIDMIAWFDEPESSHFDAQVLKQQWQSASADRLRLERVLADEVLRSRLSAGLAGPPPQLEWLLADRPMEKLFEPESQFEWLDSEAIDGVSLQRIAVTSDRERFVFWIHPATSLVRRVELPVPLAMDSGQDEWSLSLELKSASFQPPRAGQQSDVEFESRPRFEPKLVRQFVPMPPPPPSPLLGRSFQIDSVFAASGTRGSDGLKTARFVLIALPPSDDGSLRTWMPTWTSVLPMIASPTMGPAHLVFATSDRSVGDALNQLPSSLVSVIQPREVNQLLRQLRLGENSFALLDVSDRQPKSGRLLLTENATDASTIGNALAVIRDSLSGVDVPKKIRVDYDSIIRDYESSLRQNLTSN
ncbi:hypothetical protein [Aporhodopirellula aestuarii]|uniref:Uncharacterized protein n=1 Tax=Aporhodopirellula aestuarii TaxID=2950107 RepID=A0ABT0UB10_9BACT|nr:hypothetical protein [Aporhodopirellula aestuarii]MCM2374203.1 hypothetical protein [Aporhodopirellula aestuarii]